MRVPEGREPTHPGEMRHEEFLVPLGITQREFADRIGVSYVRLNKIVNAAGAGLHRQRPSGSPRALGTSPEFWLNGQTALDL